MSARPEIESFRSDLASICHGWESSEACTQRCRRVDAAGLPPTFRTLLDHREHMTTTLETFYGEPVDLRVLQCHHDGNKYHRQILLTLRETGTVVEFGIARLDFAYIPPAAREEILAQEAPLGDILIRHEILRDIEPKWFFLVDGCCPWRRYFDNRADKPAYGRLGVICCYGGPAIEMLEVVSPNLESPQILAASPNRT